jgi:hypothetical protein
MIVYSICKRLVQYNKSACHVFRRKMVRKDAPVHECESTKIKTWRIPNGDAQEGMQGLS